MQTRITIGITCYNAAATIADAIDSALGQFWVDKEIIVVDDVSSDNSLEVVARYPQVKLIRHTKNQGVAAARNSIIHAATGDFVAFFDDDDISKPDRLTKQYNRITAYERLLPPDTPVICHTARLQVYPDATTRIEPTMGMDETTAAPHGIDVALRMLVGKPMTGGMGSTATCSQMARLSTNKTLGGFDAALRRGEDTDLNIRLALRGGHFVGIAEPLVTQHMTRGSEKALADEEGFDRAILEKNRKVLEEYGWYDFCTGWLSVRYANLHGQGTLRPLIAMALRHPVKTVQKIIWSRHARATRTAMKAWYKAA